MFEITIKETCNDGFWGCLSSSELIQLISVSIAAIAAIFSWYAILTQKKINKKNQEAIVIPGIKSIETKIEDIWSDWDKEGKVPKKFSNTMLPIWNYGNSPVFNVGYRYYIENIEDLIQEQHNRDGLDTHKIEVRKDQDSYNLYVETKQRAEIRHIQPYIRNVDVIKPKDNTEILIPDYFIIMLNDFFINSHITNIKPPILNLKIFYDDINFKTWEQQFRIFVPHTFKISDEELTTSFHYEIIQSKKKRKRLTNQQNKKQMMKRQKKN